MSATPGKIQILGVSRIKVNGKYEKVFNLQMLQGRNPDWVCRPFYARYNPEAYWLHDLEPVFTEEFFFEPELNALREEALASATSLS